MVATLVNVARFPNLRKVIFAGHSAGGQIIQRYAMFNRLDHSLSSVKFEYYPANPSSVTYLDARRPQLTPRTCESRCDNHTVLTERWTFENVPRESQCSDSYNTYGYGLDGPLPDYPNKTTKSVA